MLAKWKTRNLCKCNALAIYKSAYQDSGVLTVIVTFRSYK